MQLQDVMDKINGALADKAAAKAQKTVIAQAQADARVAQANAQHQQDLGGALDAKAAQSATDAEALVKSFLEDDAPATPPAVAPLTPAA